MELTDQRGTSAQGLYRWMLVGLLWLVCFANYGDRQAIFSVFPPLQHAFSLSMVQLGLIGSAFMWAYALFGPIAGWWCDRVSQRWTIIGALFFWSACTAATAYCRGYHQLLLVRGLGGLGEAFYFPAAMSLIARFHGPSTRSRAMSIHQSAVYVGSIAGGALAAWMAARHGWRQPFAVFGAFGVALVLLLLIFLREPETVAAQARRTDILDGVLALLANPYGLVLCFVFVGANFVAAIFLSWTPQYLFQKFHMSLALAGFNGTAWLQGASILGVLLGGVFADGMAKGNRGGRMLAQAGGLFLGVPFLFLTGWTQSSVVVVVAMAGFGLAKGIYDANIWASLFDVVPEEHRGATVGLMNSLGWVGGGVATVGFAMASGRFGLGNCLSATAIVYGLLAFVLLRTASSLGDAKRA